MADSKKRKDRGGDRNDQSGPKRSKGGSGGKWQTPHQKTKFAGRTQAQMEPGDAGIWATCAKGQERRATEELKSMLEDCAQRFYGLSTGSDANIDDDDADSADDIEKSIQKELSKQKTTPKLFKNIHLGLPCLLFFKTHASIDPVDLVHRICTEVVQNPDIRKMRYINRLTPIVLMAKATERGLEELSSAVLAKHFQLAQSGGDEKDEAKLEDSTKSFPSYAIRPSIRAHNTLKRDVVIKQLASSISDAHKVNLTAPDKVILVEIYTTACGISVVDGDWETLKRFNLAELYPKPPGSKPTSADGEASTQSVA